MMTEAFISIILRKNINTNEIDNYFWENDMTKLEKDLIRIKGHEVIYSKTGGGNSSILLITLDNDYSLWAWCYWEIRRNEELVACSEDDDTAVVGKMARAANLLEQSRVIGIVIYDKYELMLTFSNGLELLFYTSEEYDFPNWEYWMPDMNRSYIITSKLEVKEEPYE